jgi:hypothetical protein
VKSFIKNIILSLQLILVTTLGSIIYGFVRHRILTFAYTLNACIGASVILLVTGLMIKYLPFGYKHDILTDHSTFTDRFMDKYAERQNRGNSIFLLGLIFIILTGLIQLLLAALIP